jgi:UDP-N-acetylglucosamine:LPS N-acetylglucosamine transferase
LLEPIDPVYKVTDKLSAIREVLDEVKPKLNPMFQKLLENIAPRLTFRVLQSDQFYNEMLKRGVRGGLDMILPILQNFIRLSSKKIIALMQQHWILPGNKPDMVISVIPNFNEVLYRALKKIYPHVPYVTIMTDMVDIPPHFWMEKQDQVMICGTPKAYQQAIRSKFYRKENIHLVSGMILKKCFYNDLPNEAVTLRSLGLSSSPRTKTAVVMFGGNGSATSQHIVDQLNVSDLDVQTIVLCGHNKELYVSLMGKDRCCPVPFTSDVTPYLRLADFMIGKPGPGSISEAVQMGCPVLVQGNAVTLPQERPNIDWILQNGVGATVKDFTGEIVDAVRRMIDDLDVYRANIAKLPHNRAVFEIADILSRIMDNPMISVNENIPDSRFKKWRMRRLPATPKRPRWKKILKRTR